METIKNIAAVVGCISAIIGLLMVIFKPIRQHIIDTVIHRNQSHQVAESITKINEKLNVLDDVVKRLERVEKNVLDNESERLKAELFTCGNRCRRGIYLYTEEFEHIRQVYDRYSNVLHKNHDGTREWEFIYDYYTKQQLKNNTK